VPHFTIEYSANLDARVDMADVVEVVRKAAVETGIFPLGGIRVRAVRCEHYAIGDGNPDFAFLDMLLRLGEGRDLQTRREAEAFLVARGYRIAPVTLDAWDWNFAGVYADAKKRGDAALQQEVVSSYISYHAEMFAYEEKLSKDLIGYEPKQILLLHANQLEADHIGELLDMMRKRGYRFITLEDALSDSAYSLPDTFVGESGTGWIEHWAITRGQPPQGSPVFPASIDERAKALPHPQF